MTMRRAAGRIVRILDSKTRVKSIEPWQSPAEGPKELSMARQVLFMTRWKLEWIS